MRLRVWIPARLGLKYGAPVISRSSVSTKDRVRPADRVCCVRIMGFNCGIVGLPNVGKSTLFNALTATAAAEAANYPFCTIEPNVGRVAVPDERLAVCARLAKSAKIIPTQLEFVDIAGLVRGASQGQGLGNQFLGHIREVDAIAQVAALLRRRQRRACRGLGRSDPRRRDGRDRADAGRSRKPRTPRRRGRRSAPAAASARPGRSSTSSSRCWRRCATAGRRVARRSRPSGRRESAGAATADREADPLYRQCRRGERRDGQCARAAGSPITPRRRARARS